MSISVRRLSSLLAITTVAALTIAACGGSDSSSRNRNFAFEPDPEPCVRATGSIFFNPSVWAPIACPNAATYAIVANDGTVGKRTSLNESYLFNPFSHVGPTRINTYDDAGVLIATDDVSLLGSKGGRPIKITVNNLSEDDNSGNATILEAAPSGWSGEAKDPEVGNYAAAKEFVDSYNRTQILEGDWTIPTFGLLTSFTYPIASFADLKLDMNRWYFSATGPNENSILTLPHNVNVQRRLAGYLETHSEFTVRPARLFTVNQMSLLTVTPVDISASTPTSTTANSPIPTSTSTAIATIGKPTDVVATALNNGTIDLSWVVPTSGMFDRFEIQMTTDGSTQWVLGGDSETTRTNISKALQLGHGYQFEIRVTNGDVKGEWSDITPVVTTFESPQTSTRAAVTTTPSPTIPATTESPATTSAQLNVPDNIDDANTANCDKAPTIGYQDANEQASFVITAHSDCVVSGSVTRVRLTGKVVGEGINYSFFNYDSNTAGTEKVAIKNQYLLEKGQYTITAQLIVSIDGEKDKVIEATSLLVNNQTPIARCEASNIQIVEKNLSMNCAHTNLSASYIPEAGHSEASVYHLDMTEGALSLTSIPSGWNMMHVYVSYVSYYPAYFTYLICVSECSNFSNTKTAPQGVSVQWNNKSVSVHKIQECGPSTAWVSTSLSTGIRLMTPFVLANSDGPSGEGSRSEFDFSDGSAITLMEELNCDSQDEGIKYLVHHIVGQEKGAPAEVTPELIPGHELDTTNVNPTMGDKAVEFLAVNFADEKPGVSSSPLVVTTDTKAIALDVAAIGSLFANAGGNAVVSMSIDGGKAVKLTPFEAGHIALPDGAKKLDISVTNTETGKTVTYTKEIVVADSAQAANSSGSGFSVIFLVIAALLALLIAAGVTAQRRKSQVSAE